MPASVEMPAPAKITQSSFNNSSYNGVGIVSIFCILIATINKRISVLVNRAFSWFPFLPLFAPPVYKFVDPMSYFLYNRTR